jgi:hypothetical protein
MYIRGCKMYESFKRQKKRMKNYIGDKLGNARDPATGNTLWRERGLFVPYNIKGNYMVISSQMLKEFTDEEIADYVLKLYWNHKYSGKIQDSVGQKKHFWSRKKQNGDDVLSVEEIVNMKDKWLLGSKNGLIPLEDRLKK